MGDCYDNINWFAPDPQRVMLKWRLPRFPRISEVYSSECLVVCSNLQPHIGVVLGVV